VQGKITFIQLSSSCSAAPRHKSGSNALSGRHSLGKVSWSTSNELHLESPPLPLGHEWSKHQQAARQAARQAADKLGVEKLQAQGMPGDRHNKPGHHRTRKRMSTFGKMP
jgi:hypothetical protein